MKHAKKNNYQDDSYGEEECPFLRLGRVPDVSHSSGH